MQTVASVHLRLQQHLRVSGIVTRFLQSDISVVSGVDAALQRGVCRWCEVFRMDLQVSPSPASVTQSADLFPLSLADLTRALQTHSS